MSKSSNIEDHVNLTEPTDEAQKYQIDTFMMGIHCAMHHEGTKLVVMEVREKSTGLPQNMVAIMESTPEGVRCLPLAILPRGKHLVKDYEAMTVNGTPAEVQQKAGSWNPNDAGTLVQ